jgi:creatinine amidohydrolase
MDVERYLQHDDRLVFVVGSCEQHGYLSLATDVKTPMAIAREACRRTGALLAPPIAYGVSPYFMAYPGTFSLRPETLATIMRDLLEQAIAQGFRRILVNNGHGGNTGVLNPVLIETGNAHPNARLGLYHWWRHPDVIAAATQAGYVQNHANWSENFTFTRLGPVPEGSKETPTFPDAASAATMRQILGDGSFGGPYQAPQEVSDRLFTAAVNALVAAIESL